MPRFLEADDPDAEALRQEMEYVLAELPPESDTRWKSSTFVPSVPSDGPAYGTMHVPVARSGETGDHYAKRMGFIGLHVVQQVVSTFNKKYAPSEVISVTPSTTVAAGGTLTVTVNRATR